MTIPLANRHLLKTKIFINNTWHEATNHTTFGVTNPANGEIIAHVANGGIADIVSAIEAAHAAFSSWSSCTAKQRSAIMRAWYNLILENADDLAILMTTEQGKPLPEAKGEVSYGASFIEWFAEESKRAYGDIIPTPLSDRRIMVLKQPVGVVAAITPWNFPVSMITRKIAPAIAAGCTVVIKPASQTPLCALALAQLAKDAGFPEGVINVVTSDNASEIGNVMTTHPLVSKFSFTGSTKVGKLLMSQCASTIKKISLELGGNAPLIVFDDADVEVAVKGAIASKYRNAGQTCVCANRLYIQQGIYDRFMTAFRDAVSRLIVGEGTKEGVDIGPLIDDKALTKVNDLLKDAVAKGGKITAGGHQPEESGLYFEPTVVEDCNDKMKIKEEEIFGPVSAIYKFESEDEVIKKANDTEYGLAAYFFTKDLQKAWRVSESLHYGIIGINEGIVSHAEAPFGGMKQSGIGREGSKYGLEEYLEVKYVCVGNL